MAAADWAQVLTRLAHRWGFLTLSGFTRAYGQTPAQTLSGALRVSAGA